MTKTMLSAFTAVFLSTGFAAGVSAAPASLTDSQMDRITAGQEPSPDPSGLNGFGLVSATALLGTTANGSFSVGSSFDAAFANIRASFQAMPGGHLTLSATAVAQ